MEIPAFAKPVMFNQKRKIMVQTKEMKNYKTEVADNNVLNVVYGKNTNLGYTVNYYKDSVDADNLLDSDSGTGTYGDEIPYTDGKYLPAGYVTPGTVSGQTDTTTWRLCFIP